MNQPTNKATVPQTGSVEIWFRLVKSADGYPKSQDWEEIWARPTDTGFTLENIPFFENRVSRGDVVTASVQGDGFLQFESVLRRGGHSTFRVLVDPARTDAKQLMAEVKRLGADCEETLDHLIAIDVPSAVMQMVEDFLVHGKDAKKWGIQDGFIFRDLQQRGPD